MQAVPDRLQEAQTSIRFHCGTHKMKPIAIAAVPDFSAGIELIK